MRNAAKRIGVRKGSGELPEELLLTIRGFQESRVILTGIELNVFAAVGDGATASQVAGKIGTDARASSGDDAYRASLGALVDADGMRARGNFGGAAGNCWAGR